MRPEFIDELTRIGVQDENVWLLIGDTGFGLVEKFEQACPGRSSTSG